MRTLRQNTEGNDVKFLQSLLREAGFTVPDHGRFDEDTAQAAKSFQQKHLLDDDAIVGKGTWKKLLEKGYNFYPESTNLFLNANEFVSELHYKKQIILHHTAGGPRPDFTIGWWEQDAQRVGTSFVIGRTTAGDRNFDGVVYRAFPDYLWAYHLGLSKKNSNINADLRTTLNKTSIGIEICSYGPLKKKDHIFRTVVNDKIIQPSEVTDLGEEWRDYQYFEKYTTAQLEACKNLILTLAYYFNIPVEDVTYDHDWFSINDDALHDTPGIWTHVNYRKDKTDCFPQPELIDMLNSLHSSFKDFTPNMTSFESFREENIKNLPAEELKDYSFDLVD